MSIQWLRHCGSGCGSACSIPDLLRRLETSCRVILCRIRGPATIEPISQVCAQSDGAHGNQLTAGLTTLTHGLPSARRLILSAMVFWRRRIVPEVQPDMCGVITTFGKVWNGSADGRTLG